ncbi:CLUMA_CG017356, isoform A [Clunio marinus]|uniref:CLUMA_CG017356, isoform A n=1 Tax=Clunio marinus TaxID=568069 RepID=A0A1J1IVX6_9DIPT|nr:CLUMA_CG017356, isoform A [Clunio marinus]
MNFITSNVRHKHNNMRFVSSNFPTLTILIFGSDNTSQIHAVCRRFFYFAKLIHFYVYTLKYCFRLMCLLTNYRVTLVLTIKLILPPFSSVNLRKQSKNLRNLY